MKHILTPGLHIAIVTNPLGGCGGSMFAWETFFTCVSKGIPAILATFDHWHLYPEKIGLALKRLWLPDSSNQFGDTPRNLETLANVCIEARTKSKFLIIDLKAGFSTDPAVLDVLKNSCLRDASSKAGLIPILPAFSGASAIAVEAFMKAGIYLKSGEFGVTKLVSTPRPCQGRDFP